MSFRPVLPLGGYAGWRFLQRTLPAQQAAFAQSAEMTRKASYVRENMAGARTAADLVADRRLLEVGLGAFGLSEDINAKAFIQKVLEGGTTDPKALANRLSDKRYAALSLEFGYGDLGGLAHVGTFADKLLARYQTQAFQEAVGAQDDDMRLVLNLGGALDEVLKSTANSRAQWFQVMGNPPLRAVFEKALGLPKSFGALDIDRQHATFQARAEATFGTSDLARIAEPENREKMIRLFFLRAETQAPATSAAAMALQLLRG